MNMKLSEHGAASLRLHEGFVPNWYRDPAGIPTIGIGFTWRSSSFREWWRQNRTDKFGPGARMGRKEADNALRYLVDTEYGEAVNDFLGDQVIQQHQFDAMCSMVYNCGVGALEWKWAQAIRRGDFQDAAQRWRKTALTADGRRLPGLVRRRKEEARLFLQGIYGGKVDFSEPEPDAEADGILERGERGKAVRELQLRLNEGGFECGKPDGLFGPGTERAVMAAQEKFGFPVDGKASNALIAKLANTRKVFPTEIPYRTDVPVPPPPSIPGLDKPMTQSKTVWSSIVAFGGSMVSAFGNLHPYAQIGAVALVGVCVFLIVRERLKYRRLSRELARERHA